MDKLKSYKQSVMRIYRRSFSRGVGSIISIPGNYFPVLDLSAHRDTKALQNDWKSVGGYMRQALRESKIQ